MLTREFVELFFVAGLILNAAAFLPQMIKLYKLKDATSLSLLTFAGFNLIQLSMMLHGFMLKDYLLAFGIVLSFITCGVVTIMIVLYGKGKGCRE